MFSGLVTPPLDMSGSYKKTKHMDDGMSYVSLEDPVFSSAGLSFISPRSRLASSDDEVAHFSRSALQTLRKSHSVESSQSSEGTTSPLPESLGKGISLCMPEYSADLSVPAKHKRRIPKLAEKTVKSVINSFSPKISKKKLHLPTSDPVWPNSMSTYARGITKSRQSNVMVAPEEPSIFAITLQEEVKQREFIHNTIHELQRNTDNLIDFSDDEISTKPNDGILTSKDIDLVCRFCRHNVIEKEEMNNNVDLKTCRHIFLSEAPPVDECFA